MSWYHTQPLHKPQVAWSEMGSEGDLFDLFAKEGQSKVKCFLSPPQKRPTIFGARSYQSIFASWRQHRNGSFWSCKLSTNVLSLHTQGAWTEREGCTNWYRGSRKRHAVWGATGGRSENVVFIPVFVENGSNPNQMIPSCPPVLLVDFLRKFFCERRPNKTHNRQKKLWLFISCAMKNMSDFICHWAFLLFCSSKWWMFIFRIWKHHNFQVLPGESFIFLQLTW